MPGGTRDRFITATIELFRQRGYNGTSLKAITAAAGAPTGSLYHHFKGGKAELTDVVLVSAGEVYLALLMAIWDESGDAVGAIKALFDGAATVLEETDFIDPCPVGGVAREVASTDDGLRRTAQQVFESWTGEVERRLRSGGVGADDSRELALALVAAIEGAFVLARTARDGAVLTAVGHQMAAAVAGALGRVVPSG